MFGLSKNHLEKDGKIMKEKISQRSFLERRRESEKGRVCRRRAQVHQSRREGGSGII